MTAASPIFRTIGIVGLGLIGGSVALAARRAWPSCVIIGVDRPEVVDAAIRQGIVDGGGALATLASADVVVLAAPVQQNLAVLPQLASVVSAAAVVTDTGSTKRDIVEAARQVPGLTFVGGHPLGGAAAAGLSHARADLFDDRPWLFTPPSGDAASAALARLTAFAQALGSTVQVVEVEAHDHWLAFISHLPQMTASALLSVVGDAVGDEGLALAGRGLIDTTRLAGSPSPIWTEIAASNADEIGPALDILIARLQDLRHDLRSGQRIRDTFDRAGHWRQRLLSRG